MLCERGSQFGSECSLNSIPSAFLTFPSSVGVKKTTHNFTVLRNGASWTRAIERRKLQEKMPFSSLVASVKIRRFSWHFRSNFSPQPSGRAIVLSSLINFIFLTPVSPERQFADKQGKRPALAHHSSSPPGKKQRRDTDTIRGKASCLVYWHKTG